MFAIDILVSIINSLALHSHNFLLIEHSVETNWRQKYQSDESKFINIKESLIYPCYIAKYEVLGNDILQKGTSFIRNLVSNKQHVISVASCLTAPNGDLVHLPFMNFHPEIDNLQYLSESIKFITKNQHGYLVATGRFYHFYGQYLLTPTEWLNFNCDFLLPTVLVSERYISHSLRQGYNTLRLTSQEPFKPKTPHLILEL